MTPKCHIKGSSSLHSECRFISGLIANFFIKVAFLVCKQKNVNKGDFMPIHNPRQLGYSNYVRSITPGNFDTYDKPDISVCWMDLLGVRGMSHAQIVSVVTKALDLAAEATCTGPIHANGNLIGTPNNAAQFAIVGDALVLTEKDNSQVRQAMKLAFFYRVNILSRLLNEANLIHRGVVSTGDVKCFVHEGSSIITGAGVVKAAELEKNLKTAGLFYDDTWSQFIQGRQSQIDQHSYTVPLSQIQHWNAQLYAPNLAGVTFSQYHGWDHWKNIISSGDQTNNKVQNAGILIDALKNQFGMP